MKDRDEKLLDLLYLQAVRGLTEDEQREMEQFDAESLSTAGGASIEAVVTMISLAGIKENESLPPHLAERITEAADEFFGSRAASESSAREAALPTVPAAVASRPSRTFFDWMGWAVAAAACIALALNIYSTRSRTAEVAKNVPPQVATPTPTLSDAQLRQQLIETSPDLVRASVSGAGKEFQSVTGDVVWSEQKQTGYIRFSGLPVNDQSRATYQIWLFQNPTDKTPVDGGIFNVNESGEVIIPIKPRVRSGNPKMFAVTVEKPGGVVVSNREKIAAIAKTET